MNKSALILSGVVAELLIATLIWEHYPQGVSRSMRRVSGSVKEVSISHKLSNDIAGKRGAGAGFDTLSLSQSGNMLVLERLNHHRGKLQKEIYVLEREGMEWLQRARFISSASDAGFTGTFAMTTEDGSIAIVMNNTCKTNSDGRANYVFTKL